MFILIRPIDARFIFLFFLMIRRPPRSTLDRSSAASDVYKRQGWKTEEEIKTKLAEQDKKLNKKYLKYLSADYETAVSYTHLRAHETVLDLVCRLLLEKKKKKLNKTHSSLKQHK